MHADNEPTVWSWTAPHFHIVPLHREAHHATSWLVRPSAKAIVGRVSLGNSRRDSVQIQKRLDWMGVGVGEEGVTRWWNSSRMLKSDSVLIPTPPIRYQSTSVTFWLAAFSKSGHQLVSWQSTPLTAANNLSFLFVFTSRIMLKELVFWELGVLEKALRVERRGSSLASSHPALYSSLSKGYGSPCSLPELACVWLCGCLAAFSVFRRVFPWNDVHLPRIHVALIAVLSACCNTTLCADLSPKDPAHCVFFPPTAPVEYKIFPKPRVFLKLFFWLY